MKYPKSTMLGEKNGIEQRIQIKLTPNFDIFLMFPNFLNNIYGTKWRNKLKMDSNRKCWYLVLPTFW